MILAYNIVGYGTFIAGLVYAAFGFIAQSHLQVSYRRREKWMPLFMWPFKSERYDDFGKGICRLGKPLFVVIWLGFSAWMVMRVLIFE